MIGRDQPPFDLYCSEEPDDIGDLADQVDPDARLGTDEPVFPDLMFVKADCICGFSGEETYFAGNEADYQRTVAALDAKHSAQYPSCPAKPTITIG